MAIPKRVVERIQAGLKTFAPVLTAQRDRDVSEADTVTLVKDILAGVFGYDKYAELTSEHSIRGTYCDLAIKLDGKVRVLIEVKAIGQELRDGHIKQAVDYAANQGVEWVALTNGICWQLYHVLFKKPIDRSEVCTLNLLEMSGRNEEHLERLFLFSKEGVVKDVLTEYRDRKDATSRFMLAAILINAEPVLAAVRREVRRVSEISVDQETIVEMLREQVIKRDALEGDQADAAVRRFNRNKPGAKAEAAAASPATPPAAATPAATGATA